MWACCAQTPSALDGANPASILPWHDEHCCLKLWAKPRLPPFHCLSWVFCHHDSFNALCIFTNVSFQVLPVSTTSAPKPLLSCLDYYTSIPLASHPCTPYFRLPSLSTSPVTDWLPSLLFVPACNFHLTSLPLNLPRMTWACFCIDTPWTPWCHSQPKKESSFGRETLLISIWYTLHSLWKETVERESMVFGWKDE